MVHGVYAYNDYTLNDDDADETDEYDDGDVEDDDN